MPRWQQKDTASTSFGSTTREKGSQIRIVSAPKSHMGQPAVQPVVLPPVPSPCSHRPPKGLYPTGLPPSRAATEKVVEGPSLDTMLEMLRNLGYVVTKESPPTVHTALEGDPGTSKGKEKAGATSAQSGIHLLETVPETQIDVRGHDSAGSVAWDGSSKAAAAFVSKSPISVDGPSKTPPTLNKRPGFVFFDPQGQGQK